MRGFLEGYVYQYRKYPKAESKSESKSKTECKTRNGRTISSKPMHVRGAFGIRVVWNDNGNAG